ncbi:hypothetical protein ABZ615_12705 [Streptomyces sp. NPDC007325]|uniref:hypothetical protein n=1 Tax=Streptomyces sp. NPDC007325 TaxID=3154588 RepID=UPI0033DE5F8C
MRLFGISSKSPLRFAVLGLSACLLVTACGGQGKPEPERVTAGQQCDETLTPDAARSLETVLGTKRFSHDPKGGLERVTSELIQDYTKPVRGTPYRYLCRAGLPVGSGTASIDVRFGFYEEDDLFGEVHPRGLHPYDVGVEAQSGPKRAHLFVRCVSPRFEGSDKRPARVGGRLDFSRSELPDTVPVREANLTILHSVTLAVVRKLGCEDDAGLTEKPVFKALPE